MILKNLIIGSGPAGYTAAIYAARANLSPVLLTGIQPGGQLTTTNEVENFPGYPEGVTGTRLMEDLRLQAERYEAEVVLDAVSRVDFNTGGNYHSVWTENGGKYDAQTVIIATGSAAKYLGLPSEQSFVNRGVSGCAVCDGFFYRGKKVGVVGGGDTACEDAIYLSNICPEVNLFVRRDELRASSIMQTRVMQIEKIRIFWNTEIQEVLGDTDVSGVLVRNNSSAAESKIELEGLFIAIGHTPATELFKEQVDCDDQGYIITVPNSTRTSVQGVFACGDVVDRVYRQAITAAGTGCMAALDSERYIAKVTV
ncbi:thioredoxin-disulfide reductase [Desulfopila aestuarii]|uniref:Thioredoxin reductase n=1 Tax=Desulfopila aestuarii DSM 18488 TaxID=1121416 RepID=A0A1M7YJ11_9BACT|nr:thioredoxin-disulfide reductase [Desulfopila aestuarii]SHO52561.1 thioredoxin reductase (NADPH) [Desulfopila aestuarii DSM 18488]